MITDKEREKLKAKYGNYRHYYPDAQFAPWDDPPVGRRVEKDNMTGVVVGMDLREFISEKLHRDCATCLCPNENPLFGWWRIKSDRYKHPDTGEAHVMIEYPPGWKLVKERE